MIAGLIRVQWPRSRGQGGLSWTQLLWGCNSKWQWWVCMCSNIETRSSKNICAMARRL